MTHKWPFYANYMNIFHKTEIQTVILRCIVGLNLNWIKSNDMITVKVLFFHAWKCKISGVFHRVEFWHLWRKAAIIFSKWLFFQNSLIISCLQMHHFKASLPKWFLTPPKEINSHIFKMAIFPKFFETFISHLIR